MEIVWKMKNWIFVFYSFMDMKSSVKVEKKTWFYLFIWRLILGVIGIIYGRREKVEEVGLEYFGGIWFFV